MCNDQTLPDSFFRDLDAKEIESFKQWARDNHHPGAETSGLWHPIIREECKRIDKENKPNV